MPELGASIGKVLAFNPLTAKDGMEGGGAPLVKLLYWKGDKLAQWIRLPKLHGITFQKNQKVVYYGLPNQCYRCKGIGHLPKFHLLDQGIEVTSPCEGHALKPLQWQTVNRRQAFRGKEKN